MIADIFRRLLINKKEPFLFKGYQENTLSLNTDETGLYLHVPFCKSLCPYCPYNKVKYQEALLEPYKNALIKELQMYKALKPELRFTSLYIGGGTPSLFMAELAEIIAYIRREFAFDGDIGIELHPSTVNVETLRMIKACGINMLSIGIQSFHRQHLQFLGRGYDEGYLDKTLRLISEFDFDCVDIDIMTSLPEETIEEIEADVRKALSYNVDQLSIYPLIVFPMTTLYQEIKSRGISRLNELQEYRVLQLIEGIASEMGYEKTSVWTYGRKERKRYTSVTREDFIGIGSGASSRVDAYFYTNTFDIKAYTAAVNNGKLPINLVNVMTEKEQMIFWIFWRCYDGIIDSDRFRQIFGKEMASEFKLLFSLMKLLGIARKDAGSYYLTKWGAYLYHLVEKRYSISYLNKLWRESMKRPWIEELTL